MNNELTNQTEPIIAGKQTDDEIIKEAMDYLEVTARRWGDSFREAREDLKMLSGDHWPEAQKRARELDGRPVLTINKLPTFANQITNDARQNRTSIKISPVGTGTDDEDAEVVQGMIRHIEYDSGSEVATDTALASAVHIGFGFYRFIVDYCSNDTFEQEVRYSRIRNPFTVAFDPGSTEPDGSDQMRCLVHVKSPKSDFLLEYPDATLPAEGLNPSRATGEVVWFDGMYVRTGEYYRIEKTPEELHLMSDGGVIWDSEMPKELPPGVRKIRTRKSYRKKVMLYKLTAHEILERMEIFCDWIPVFPVYGAELDIDGKVIYSGVIRHARDPQMMYDFWMTSATEEVALRPKTPYIGAEGAFEGYEDQWGQANVRSFPFLEYNPVSLEGVLAPPPQRQPMADIPNGMLSMAMHANDNIKATTGLFDSSLGASGNATSGRQELAQQHQGNTSNFHYVDNLLRTRRHDARCLISMIPHYYDTERVVNIMREDGEIEPKVINQQMTPEMQQAWQTKQAMKQGSAAAPPSDDMAAIKRVLNDVVNTKYAVVVSTGPSYSTMRKESADAMVQFGQSWPKLMDIAGDKVVKALDWPGADEIAERIERTIPPNIRYDPKDPNAGPPPLPPEVEQQLKQADEIIQELHKENEELKTGVMKAKMGHDAAKEREMIKAEVAIQIANVGADAKKDVEEIKGMVAMLIAKMQPPPEVKTAASESMVG